MSIFCINATEAISIFVFFSPTQKMNKKTKESCKVSTHKHTISKQSGRSCCYYYWDLFRNLWILWRRRVRKQKKIIENFPLHSNKFFFILFFPCLNMLHISFILFAVCCFFFGVFIAYFSGNLLLPHLHYSHSWIFLLLVFIAFHDWV